MIVMHFINETTEKEYVTFVEAQDFGVAEAKEEYARPGFTLKGAWEIEPERLSPDFSHHFLPATYQEQEDGTLYAVWPNGLGC